jgi:hypothetical protein
MRRMRTCSTSSTSSSTTTSSSFSSSSSSSSSCILSLYLRPELSLPSSLPLSPSRSLSLSSLCRSLSIRYKCLRRVHGTRMPKVMRKAHKVGKAQMQPQTLQPEMERELRPKRHTHPTPHMQASSLRPHPLVA